MATIRFCPECNNMLYPKEDRQNRVLLFACRNCEHQEEAETHCVYRNDVISIAIKRRQAAVDLSADPTLPRTDKTRCPRCGFHEAVFFQSRDRRRDAPMTLTFVCCNTNCNHTWAD